MTNKHNVFSVKLFSQTKKKRKKKKRKEERQVDATVAAVPQSNLAERRAPVGCVTASRGEKESERERERDCLCVESL